MSSNFSRQKKYGGFFGAKRFDRDGTNRIHMISLSSMLETSHRIPNLDYSHLFQVVQKICMDQSDMYEVFRRMAFNVFYGNKDDHGKNFAFLYDESAHSILSKTNSILSLIFHKNRQYFGNTIL